MQCTRELVHAWLLLSLLLVWINNHVRPVRSSPAHMNGLDLAQYKKKKKRKDEWTGLGPQAHSAQTIFAKGVSHRKIFISLLFWYLAKQTLFDIRKFSKYLGTFADLFMVPSRIFFFLIVFCFFFPLFSLYAHFVDRGQYS